MMKHTLPLHVAIPLHERPLADAGLTSYRCRTLNGFNWIMIGATDHADAMRQARRSYAGACPEGLQIWNGSSYVPVDLETGEK